MYSNWHFLSYFVVFSYVWLYFVLLCHILYSNEPVCVVHFMCSGTLKCLIQHSSEPVYSNVLFMNCYICVVHFIDTVILQ